MTEREQFDKWRGPCPVSGFSQSLIRWNHETEELWKCWQAANILAKEIDLSAMIEVINLIVKVIRTVDRNLKPERKVMKMKELAAEALSKLTDPYL